MVNLQSYEIKPEILFEQESVDPEEVFVEEEVPPIEDEVQFEDIAQESDVEETEQSFSNTSELVTPEFYSDLHKTIAEGEMEDAIIKAQAVLAFDEKNEKHLSDLFSRWNELKLLVEQHPSGFERVMAERQSIVEDFLDFIGPRSIFQPNFSNEEFDLGNARRVLNRINRNDENISTNDLSDLFLIFEKYGIRGWFDQFIVISLLLNLSEQEFKLWTKEKEAITAFERGWKRELFSILVDLVSINPELQIEKEKDQPTLLFFSAPEPRSRKGQANNMAAERALLSSVFADQQINFENWSGMSVHDILRKLRETEQINIGHFTANEVNPIDDKMVYGLVETLNYKKHLGLVFISAFFTPEWRDSGGGSK